MVESLNKKDIFEADHKVMVVISSPVKVAEEGDFITMAIELLQEKEK